MNPLELLKERLRIKPVAEEHKTVDIIIPIPTAAEKVTITGVTLLDKRDPGFDRTELNKRLERAKLIKTSIQIQEKEKEKGKEKVLPIPELSIKKKAKKITKTVLLGLQEDGVPIIEGDQEETVKKAIKEKGIKEKGIKEKGIKEKGTKKKGKLVLKIVEDVEDVEGEKEEEEEKEKKEKLVIKVKKGRRTKKPIKGVATIPYNEWVEIDDIDTVNRLPIKEPKVNLKASSYFMNNREKFVEFINTLFTPYRDEVMDETSELSCDTLGQNSGSFSLLAHQKLVRDYINLYTPYRGLLLFHGLGAGKTCTSIAIAEGLKNSKKIIVMTPASLRRNYMEELKKCGDSIYKKNQFWQFISIEEHPDAMDTLSSVLNLSVEYIDKAGGAWLTNVTKPSNYTSLEPQEVAQLDAQIDEMIQYKYKFINYNGLRRNNLKDMTNNFETNIFDDAVIIIDEAHNFISRIVNKIAKEKEIPIDKHGKKEKLPIALSLVLYELLLSAKNARVILLTGTPIINYPNEIGILFNILRGYIKTWEIPLDIKSGQAVNKEKIEEIFEREKIMDYIDYSKDKVLTITRNPLGFENKSSRDNIYQGVTTEKKKRDSKGNIFVEEVETISDTDFERKIIHILEQNNIATIKSNIKINLQKALPDKFDNFVELFIDANGDTKNMDIFKRRIIGLTSYFRSAQESLMPRYEQATDFKVIHIEMSDYQFAAYEQARSQERKQEKSTKKKKGVMDENGIYKEPSSTYRIFSRLYCNFVMPNPPGRPLPKEELKDVDEELEKELKEEIKEGVQEGVQEERVQKGVLSKTKKAAKKDDDEGLEEEQWDGEIEGDIAIEKIADITYGKRIENAVDYIKKHEQTFLTPDGLIIYSPKYLNMLENIEDPAHIGLHLVYSQFRTLEGIGIFKMVLEANGFTQFKVKKEDGIWDLDISEEDTGKPTFALYTGTESAEEKELIRNIFNSNWDTKSPITRKLKEIAHNNHMGEIIKVLMITASGSEGINLRSTRYVHIMEPYWHPARIEQVIGRARRICSHNALPLPLQTVEVYLYLMTFTKEQIKSDNAIELKIKDLSKKKYKLINDSGKEKEEFVPFTSDEALYEISTIKQEVSSKLITAIKESSIDCAVYYKSGSKEKLHCLSFGSNPGTNKFSYIPNYKKEEPETGSKINKKVKELKGERRVYQGKQYFYEKLDKTHGNLYDWDSYLRARDDPSFDLQLVATAEETKDGVIIRRV
jgi:hypothetical protein